MLYAKLEDNVMDEVSKEIYFTDCFKKHLIKCKVTQDNS